MNKQTFWGTLVAAAVLLTMPTSVWADSSFGGGSGNEADPYIIKTTSHMRQLANDVNGGNTYSGKFLRLDNDLDFDGQEYLPVGGNIYDNSGNVRRFSGTFDGNEKTIRGVTNIKYFSTNRLYVGLFGATEGATIKNLTLGENSTIAGKCIVGGIAGWVREGCTIVNCHTEEGVTIIANQGDFDSFGGIAGIVRANSAIIGCTNRATVTKGDTWTYQLGGIVGYNRGTVENCWNFGNIVGTHYAGGIVGTIAGGVVRNCYVTGASINGIGASESSTGYNADGQTERVHTLRFATTYDGGTLITQPTVSRDGTDYFKAGSPVEFSELHTFGSVAEGKMWEFDAVAKGHDNIRIRHLEEELWRFIMPEWDVAIASKISTDINYLKNNINVTADQTVRFNGEVQHPEMKIWDAKAGKYLKEGEDFMTDVNPDGYKDEGEYPITIWGINDYGGSRKGTFTITHAWEGEGTQLEPFLISSTDDFDMLAKLVYMGYNQSDMYFRQTADLDYEGKTFTPVGNKNNPQTFSGYYDGLVYAFRNVSYTTDENYAGLFGFVSENGTVQGVTLSGNSSLSGSIAGGIVANNYGRVSNCRIPEDGQVTISGTQCVGGIVGYNNGFADGECWATVKGPSSVASFSFTPSVGGIVGNNKDAGSVYGYFYGQVEGAGDMGGCVSRNYGQVTGVSMGTIVCTDATSKVGGVVGDNCSGGSVTHCLTNQFMAGVDGVKAAGAIIGNNDGKALLNYYTNACKFGGINGSDVKGQAVRGWPVTVDERLWFQPWYYAESEEEFPEIVGNYFEDERGHFYYVGEGETLYFMLGSDPPYRTYTANGQPIAVVGENEWGDKLYSLVMPGVPVTIAPDETTGLSLGSAEPQQSPSVNDDAWYDLSGRRLNGRPTQKGIYIYRGKKLSI